MTSPNNLFMFLVGPSAIGKSTVAHFLCSDLQLYHLDADSRGPFKRRGIKTQWLRFSTEHDASPLRAALNRIAVEENRAGVVVSLPSKKVLTPQHIRAGREVGIATVVLFGREEWCQRSACERARQRGNAWNLGGYEKRTRAAFETYGGEAFAEDRFDVFRPDGSRRSPDEVVTDIRMYLGV